MYLILTAFNSCPISWLTTTKASVVQSVCSLYTVQFGYWQKWYASIIATIYCITLLIDRYNDGLFQFSGKPFLFQTELISLWTSEWIVLPPTLISSAGILSTLGNLCLFSLITSWNSKAIGSGTSGFVVCISVCLTSLAPSTFNNWKKWFLWKFVTKTPFSSFNIFVPSW